MQIKVCSKASQYKEIDKFIIESYNDSNKTSYIIIKYKEQVKC